MKRILSLTAALLLLMLALAGCGGNAEEPAETTEDTQAAETVEPAQDTQEEAVDAAATSSAGLSQLADQMIADAGIADAIPVPQENLVKVYGLDESQIVEAVGYNASSGGAFPQEIILVQAVDEAAAAAVSDAFLTRLSDIAQQAESYDPDSAALAQSCQPVQAGSCVALFFSDQYETLAQMFNEALS